MLACARRALVSLARSACLGLAGCDSIDRPSEITNGGVAAGKSPVERSPVFPEDVPGVTHSILPEYRPVKKTRQKETSKSSKKKAKSSGKPRTVEPPNKPPTSAPVQAPQPQAAEPPSAPSQPLQLRLKTFWPEAPASGIFSR